MIEPVVEHSIGQTKDGFQAVIEVSGASPSEEYNIRKSVMLRAQGWPKVKIKTGQIENTLKLSIFCKTKEQCAISTEKALAIVKAKIGGD